MFRVSLVVDLGSWSATINAAPVIALENNVTFALPFVGLKVLVSIVVTATFTLLFE
jgi:hypothetical protein